MIGRVLTWYDDPRDAERDDKAHYRAMSPQLRIDEMVGLLNSWGKWNERRLERVARFVEVPRS